MKKLLLIAIILLPAFIKAQQYVPFPDSNAIWNNVLTSMSGTVFTRFGLMGDTSIVSIQYHKLYKLNDTILNDTNALYYGAIREQAKKLYFRPVNYSFERILYDFTKNIGDTIKNLYYDLIPSDSSMWGIVISIDSILIDGNYRKEFTLNANNNPVWIEGIGSLQGLLYSVTPALTCSCIWSLVCFQQNDSVKYLNPQYSSCFSTITGISNYPTIENSIAVLPDPVVGISKIQWSNSNSNQFSTLTINDILGRNIESFNVSGKNNITINKTDYIQGIYFAKLYALNGKYNVIKLIIQ